MDMSFDEHLAAEPAAIWPLLTEPARMNAWSEAKVTTIALGDGNRADGVGAYRVVRHPRGALLHEVVEESEAPHRFVYGIFRGAPLLRAHRGEITLTPEGTGTRMHWRVRAEFAAPGMAQLAQRATEPALRRSIQQITSLAKSARPEPLPNASSYLETDDLAPLRERAEAALAEQRAIVERLSAARDPKQWFARAYVITTELQLESLTKVMHREWVLRFIPCFHDYYVRNLERWESGRRDEVESHWAMAFHTSEKGGTRPYLLARGIMLSIRAHIEEDFPRALADTYLAHFRGRCDYSRFRADMARMGQLFQHISARLLQETPPSVMPGWLRVARHSLPPEALDAIVSRRIYDTAAQRLSAFERGRRLVAWRLASP